MTDQERQQGFYQAIRAAELAYGLTIQAEVKVEQLGEAVLMRPNLVIVPLAGWQPPENGNGHSELLPTPPFDFPPKTALLSTLGGGG